MRKYNINNKKVCLLESYDGSALFIASYIMQILLQFVFSLVLVMTKVGVEFTSSIAGICILATINELAMFVTPFVYSKIKGENLFKSAGFNRGINVSQVFIVIGIAIGTVMTCAPIANLFVKFIIWTGYDVSSVTTLVMDSWSTYILGMIFLALLPAFCEEFLYRGMISRAFGDKGIVFGIFISALFFALMHGNPIQLVHQFCLAVVCAILFYLTRSIWAGVIMHFTNNAIALTGNFIMNQTGHPDYVEPIWATILIFIIGVPLLLGLLYLFYKVAIKKRGDTNYKAPLKKEMKYQFNYLFHTEEERQVISYENKVREDQLKECESEQMQEVMKSALKEQKGKIDKRSRNSLIYALILGLAVWILNTIMGYIK